MEFELLVCKIVVTFSLIITHVSLMLIEIFLVMATSGFAHTVKEPRAYSSVYGILN